MTINKNIEVDISNDQLIIHKSEIIKMLGYDKNEPDHTLLEHINKLVNRSSSMIDPKGGYIILKKDHHDAAGEIKIENTFFKVEKIIGPQLKNADFIALFVCTIGKKIEEHSSMLMKKNEMLDGYIMNLIGSESVESVADIVQSHIERFAEQNNYRITNRYSPGYCNWNVKEQFKLFSFFPSGFCDISLTESALMNPVKSVSGIIGIGSQVKKKTYKCAACNDRDCIYRR